MGVIIMVIKYITSESTEFIDQSLFVDCLALCAFEIPYREPEPSLVEKVRKGT